MRESLRRLLQAVRLEREAFVWMGFNDRATGDAVIFIAVTQVLLLLGAGSSLFGLVLSFSGLSGLLRALIDVLVFWLVYSGVVFAVARFLFQGGGGYATIMRIVGFAYPTMLLQIASARLIGGVLGFVVGSAWFLAVVATGVRHEADLSLGLAAASAGAGIVGWIILSSILSGGLF